MMNWLTSQDFSFSHIVPVLASIPWGIYAIAAYCLLNFMVLARFMSRLRKQKAKIHSQKRRIHDLEDDVRSLYDSGTTLGSKIHSLEKAYRVLKEQQEKLTLKEPSQQAYRNAIKAIHNGEALSQIAESSGLSRGEVELLKLFQKNTDSPALKEKLSSVD